MYCFIGIVLKINENAFKSLSSFMKCYYFKIVFIIIAQVIYLKKNVRKEQQIQKYCKLYHTFFFHCL